MPKKLISSAVEREGVNLARSIVEAANCIFQEIERRNDFGNDAIIELVEGEDVRGICLAAQIKSGTSYCTETECIIPSTKGHFDYWHKHTLPVIGIVYDPTEKCAYWTFITEILKQDPQRVTKGPFTIRFAKNEINRFDLEGFQQFFLPQFLKKTIRLPRDRSIRFINSESTTMQHIGLQSLFYGYRNEPETWELLISILKNKTKADIHPYLVYLLSLVPGHGDIFWHSENIIAESVRNGIREEILKFEKNEVKKLIGFVGEEGIERGTLGQCVEAIISLVQDKMRILKEITEDESAGHRIRYIALFLLAYYSGNEAERLLVTFNSLEGELAALAKNLLEQVKTYGFIYLY